MAKEGKNVVKDEDLEASEVETEEEEVQGDVDTSGETPDRRELMGQFIDAVVTGDEEAIAAAAGTHITTVTKSILNPEPEEVEGDEEGADDSEGPDDSDSEGSEEDKDD